MLRRSLHEPLRPNDDVVLIYTLAPLGLLWQNRKCYGWAVETDQFLAQIQTFGQISASNTPLMWNGGVARGEAPPLLSVGGRGCSSLSVLDLMRFIECSGGPSWSLALWPSRKHADWCATCHCLASGWSWISITVLTEGALHACFSHKVQYGHPRSEHYGRGAPEKWHVLNAQKMSL